MSHRFLSTSKRAAVVIPAVLAGVVALAAPAQAAPPDDRAFQTISSATRTSDGSDKAALASRTWWLTSDSHQGDCTMFNGASWTVYDDGTMAYDGVVTSSDDNDAWLMQVRFFDYNGNLIGYVTNAYPDTSDHTVFAKNMPDSSLRYRWFASGRFPAHWYGSIARLQTTKRR